MVSRAGRPPSATARWAALAVAATALLSSCGGGSDGGGDGSSGDGSGALAVGSAVQLGPGGAPVAGTTGARTESVVLPDGAIDVSWTADTGALASVVALDGTTPTASGDGGLLVVEWESSSSAPGLTSSRGQAAAQGDAEDELALVSGGERTVLDVDSLDRSRGRVAAAVADPADVTLEVTFDGVTQGFGPGPDDESIPAAAQVLYDGEPVSDYQSCATQQSSEQAPSCRAEALWLPWVAGQGWAPDGELWPVVSIEGLGPDPSAPPTAIEVTSATLDGEQPLADVTGEQTAGQLDGTLVFPASSATTSSFAAELTATYDGSPPATTSGEVSLAQGTS